MIPYCITKEQESYVFDIVAREAVQELVAAGVLRNDDAEKARVIVRQVVNNHTAMCDI